MSIRVQLQQFEGPLDLLLYLIRKEEMDIFNINIVEITQQYFDYIKLMKEFDLEVAGDFIAMASTLIHIKSKMLLPQYNENGEIVANEDPRKELVQKLLEYEKYKEAAKALYERPLLNRDVWARGLREKIEVIDDEIELEDNALFSLIGSYRKAMKMLNRKIHKVTVKLQSISSRIIEMGALLRPGHSIRMVELLSTTLETQIEKSRQALITFLSLLELGKLGFVSLYQTDLYGDIHIQTNKEIDGDVLSRVEEYGNINADEVTQKLFATSQTEFVEDDADADVSTELLNAGLNNENITTDAEEFVEIASDEEILAEELNLNLSEDENFPEEQV
ncbi:MAG: segregation/condensation protein A [Bdellovibrionaceae bacterium]|nr:segregation/condensation protein A [Bdellovibrio sp.]